MADYPPQLYVTHGGKYYINAFGTSGGGNGGGSGANPFYQILGRKKLTSSGDTIDVGGASVTTNVAVFDGTNDYVSIVDSSSNLIQGRSTSWSISGWFKRNGSTDKYFISQWGKASSPDNRVFHIGIDSNGKLLYRQRTDGGQGEHFTSNNAIADNTWTHFAIVWESNGSNWQAQMYINGTADNSKTDFSNDMKGGSIDEPVYLGKNGSDEVSASSGGDYFNGRLHQILFYSSALTSANVKALYNNGSPNTSPSTTNLVAKYDLSADANDSQGSLNGTNNGATFSSDTFTPTSFVAKDNLMILYHGLASGNIAGRIRFNSDSSSSYSQRGSRNGGSDGTGGSRTNVSHTLSPATNSSDEFGVSNVMNKSDQEKLWITHSMDTLDGANQDPNRSEIVGKWANTSDSISSVSVYESESGSFDTNSEVVVLGYSDSDTSGTSAWEELASVEVSSGSVIDTSTITAKKYLMIELYTVPNGTSYSWLRFNSDTNSNYASRYSTNGGSDATSTSSDDGILFYSPLNEARRYMTAFIINDSSKEKLVIGNGVAQDSPPERRELYGKWANTSASITSIQVDSKSGSFSSGTRLKVWGFD